MISLADARRHLRIDGTQDDAEIEQKLSVAKAIVCTYVGVPYSFGVSDLSVEQEYSLDAAYLLVLGELWLNREAGAAQPLSPAVRNILDMFRAPVYA